MSDSQIEWLNTETAAKRLGITTRTLYRFINEGGLAAYRMGRVIRVKQTDVDSFIEQSRIEPGTLGHLYPDPVPANRAEKKGEEAEEADGGGLALVGSVDEEGEDGGANADS